MADQIDISRLTSAVNNLSNRVDSLQRQTNEMSNTVKHVENDVSFVKSELIQLREDFDAMVNEQRRTAAVQQAMTELVRVRQELEQNFGGYKVVRETMLGVLQATDVALVRESTIANVSEELMLANPKYWLAPVLVAVSAWIANDKALAERAIKVACDRNTEKTAITMALICRRNGRTDTCYEWLSVYFSRQKAAAFTESTYTYIDAYINGVFGPDKKHMCSDYITKWMNEIQNRDEAFEKAEVQNWNEYCQSFSRTSAPDYPMITRVPEFPRIDNYVSRIMAVDDIRIRFNDIANADVDVQLLKDAVDEKLKELISRYDDDEVGLKNEERYFFLVKELQGDTEKAKSIIAAEEQRRKDNVLGSLADMMRMSITDDVKSHSRSEKKTAVSFLNKYIEDGFASYITETKDAFPTEVTVNEQGFTTQVSGSQDLPRVQQQFAEYKFQERNAKMQRVTTTGPRNTLITAIVLAVVGVIMMFVALPVGIIALVIAAIVAIRIPAAKKNIEADQQRIDMAYRQETEAGMNNIAATVAEWDAVRGRVEAFNAEGPHRLFEEKGVA